MIGRMLLGVALLVPGSAMAQSSADATKGKALFLQCSACHSIAKGAPNKVGPNLNGVFGAKAGTRAAFNYSPAMKASTVKWDDKTLDAFIMKPQAVIPGTRMPFGGVPNAEWRKAIIAYLREATK